MTERPILFSPEMVRAILGGRKTVTRRIIKDQPPPNCLYLTEALEGDYPDGKRRWAWMDGATKDFSWHPWIEGEQAWQTCPHGEAGDLLWVKEPWRLGKTQDKRNGTEVWEHLQQSQRQGITVCYGAGGMKSVSPFERIEPTYPDDEPMPKWAGRRRHARFMPKWANRIRLEIEDVRVESLLDITEVDARAEGFGPRQARLLFLSYWDKLNGETHPAASDPWIFAIRFRMV